MIPEGWVHIRPSKVIQLFGGGAFSSSDAQNDGIRWLKIANVGIGRIKWKDESFLPPNFRDKFSQYLLQAPDIVVALTRPTLNNKLKIARMSKNDGIALLNQRVAKIISSKEVNDDFIYQFLRTDEIAYRINASLLGTDPPNLSIKVLDEFWVSLPPLPEQKKIAQILSTWDKAIETVEKLIANSQQKKKALMQQLLTGKKRFPGFDGEWKEVLLGELCKLMKGKGLSKGKLSNSGQYKCILYGELYTRYNEVIGKIVNRTDHNEGVKSESGDVLIPASTTTSGIDLANATSLKETGVLLSGDINILRTDKNLISPDFLAYVLTHVKKYDLARRAQGITIIHLYGKDIKHIKISLPSLAEQDKVVSAIASSVHEIETWQQEIEHLKQEKKALMQQLLTGKRRVKVEQQ